MFSFPALHAPFGLPHYLILGGALFCLGLYGVLTQRHAVRVLMSLELMLNAVNIVLVAFDNFVAFTPPSTPLRGQIFALFVIAVAAAEASVALAIFLLLYRHSHTVDMEKLDTLKW